MGHISGTWELLLCEYWRRSMIIIEKNTDLKRLTGRLKLRFLTEIGRLHWNQGEEVAHFAWFGEPWFNTNKTKNKYKDICKSERWYANKNKELNNYWIYQSFRKLKTLAWHSIRQAKKFPRPKNMTKIQDSFRFALCNIHVLLHNMQLFTIFKTFFFWQRKSHSHWIYCITQEIYGLVWLKDWFLILQLLINLTLFLTFTGLVSECRLNITTILGVCAPLITGGSYRKKHTS